MDWKNLAAAPERSMTEKASMSEGPERKSTMREPFQAVTATSFLAADGFSLALTWFINFVKV